jgi:hypothetical protein
VNLKCPRQAYHRFDPDIPLAAFDAADVISMEAGAIGQLLLAEVAFKAQAPHFAPKGQ